MKSLLNIMGRGNKPLIIFYLICLGHLLGCAISDPHFAGARCVDSDTAAAAAYQANLNALLQKLVASAVATTTFYRSDVVPGDSATVYGLWYCRGDIGPQECGACVAAATARCPAQKEAVIWYEECVLRYSNRPILSAYEADPWIGRHSDTTVSGALGMNADRFAQNLVTGLDGLVMRAAYASGDVKFYAGQRSKLTARDSLNSVAQCSPGINTSQVCETCLRRLIGSDMTSCCGRASLWAMLFSPTCVLIYTVTSTSTTPTTRQTQSSTGTDSGKNLRTVGILVAAAFCAVGLFLAIWWWVHWRHIDLINGPVPMLPVFPPPSTPPPWGPGSLVKRPVYPGEPESEHGLAVFINEIQVHNHYGCAH